MFFYSGFYNVKRVGLLTFLMTQSMFAQVLASDVAAQSPGGEQQRAFQLPGWPERRMVEHQERVPPPPPGPYMSTALSGSSVKGFSFVPVNKPAIKLASPDSRMQAFSPDIPWQSNSNSPGRWKPENGYSYVKPPVERQSYPVMTYNMPPNYNYGYRAPVMNRPDTARPNAYVPNAHPQNGGYTRSRTVMNNSAMQSRQTARRAP